MANELTPAQLWAARDVVWGVARNDPCRRTSRGHNTPQENSDARRACERALVQFRRLPPDEQASCRNADVAGCRALCAFDARRMCSFECDSDQTPRRRRGGRNHTPRTRKAITEIASTVVPPISSDPTRHRIAASMPMDVDL